MHFLLCLESFLSVWNPLRANGKNPPSNQSPGKLSIFLVLFVFPLSLHKIRYAHQHKKFIFEINKDRSIASQSLEFSNSNLLFQEAFGNGGFSTKFLQLLAEKYLVAEWLSLLPYKSGYINSKILEISKGRPDTPPSLIWLQQRVHDLEA